MLTKTSIKNTMIPKKTRPVFDSGYIFAHKYKILKLLGQGGYGDIYSVEDISANQDPDAPKAIYAMKTESIHAGKKGLNEDITFLADLQKSPYFPRMYERGMTQTHRYLIMELLGPSISNTRRQMPQHKFSVGTTLRIGIFMLECIKVFHEHGFVHRDVKPGNFLIRSVNHPTDNMDIQMNNSTSNDAIHEDHTHDSHSDHATEIKDVETTPSDYHHIHEEVQNPLVLIDFGLSKHYIDPETNQPFPERPKVGFRGTAKYASLPAHHYKDQCPRDDLISWCYSLVELVDGRLPWGNITDAQRIERFKVQITPKQLFKSLPEEFLEIWQYLNSLTYLTAVPKYDYLFELLSRSFYRILRVNIHGITLITSYNDIPHSSSVENAEDPKLNRKIVYDETGSIRPPFDWEMLSQERIESYSGVSTLPNSYQAPMPPLLTANLITEEDEQLEMTQTPSRCRGCLII